MRKTIILLAALFVAGCNQTVQIAKPCGVIEDDLRTVRATNRDGNFRLANHFERGVSAGCWKR